MPHPADVVSAVLLERGWATDVASGPQRVGASRWIQTAVGPKQAFVLLAPGDGVSCDCVLRGTYESEGRNVLSSCSKLIPIGASDDAVAAHVRQFCDDAEHQIKQSYAAHLWSLGVGRPAGPAPSSASPTVHHRPARPAPR